MVNIRVLALDTSSMVASAALVDDERILGEILFNYKRQHSTILVPMIDRLMSSLETDIKEVDCIACTSGPGSFTGLRIGAATAKGLCHGAGKPLIGVPTLDSLAYNLAYTAGIVCPIIDALRDNVYTALYRWEDGDFNRITDYMAVSLNELSERLKAFGENVIFLGDGVFVYEKALQERLGSMAQFAPRALLLQKASSAAYIAMKRLVSGDTDDYMEFAPFYLRKSQAEREYERARGGKNIL